MSIAELQKKLIEKISKTSDAALLEDIYNFMRKDEEVTSFYKLSEDQLFIVEESRVQIKNGEGISDDDINNDIAKWLEK